MNAYIRNASTYTLRSQKANLVNMIKEQKQIFEFYLFRLNVAVCTKGERDERFSIQSETQYFYI